MLDIWTIYHYLETRLADFWEDAIDWKGNLVIANQISGNPSVFMTINAFQISAEVTFWQIGTGSIDAYDIIADVFVPQMYFSSEVDLATAIRWCE